MKLKPTILMDKGKLTPLEVVERYHERYLEYELAFNSNPVNQEELKKEIGELIKSGLDMDSEEFLNKMTEIVIEAPQKRSDVNNAALKFISYCDFFMLTQKKELPENIMKDYSIIPIKDTMKPFFSIHLGKFVRNEEQKITPEIKKWFKEIINQIKINE